MRRIWPIALALAVLALAGAWLWPRASVPAPSAAPVRTTSPGVRAEAAVGPPTMPLPVGDDPRIVAYRQRQAFDAEARRFFADAHALRPVARSEEAQRLSAQIDRYEAERALSAGEAMLLRTGLIEATSDDDAERAARVAALAERYRTIADRRQVEYESAHARDPRFRDYKAREATIVAEVMRLPTIPGGLSRDEYLRQRLQDARVAAYR